MPLPLLLPPISSLHPLPSNHTAPLAVRTDYDERVLPSIVNEVSKAVVAKYNASELLTKREVVSSQIRQQLEKRANEFRMVLDDVSITHLTFSREYTNAVEAKQVGEYTQGGINV
jgi:regulator of protease activity HflC (stomatin/prohibitin superfamily)